MKIDYLHLLKEVFYNDGLQNNVKLLNSVKDYEYLDHYEDKGFIFAEFNKSEKCCVDDNYLSSNYQLVNKYRSNNDAYIGLIVVGKKYQGLGIGKELVNRFISECKKRNVKNIYLWTDLTCNKEFYDKLGFEIVLEYNNIYFEEFCNVSCNEEYNTLIYKLSLS